MLVELKGTRKDLDEVENGEREEVELELKEAERDLALRSSRSMH